MRASVVSSCKDSLVDIPDCVDGAVCSSKRQFGWSLFEFEDFTSDLDESMDFFDTHDLRTR